MLVTIIGTIALLTLLMSAVYWREVRPTCERCGRVTVTNGWALRTGWMLSTTCLGQRAVYQAWHCPRCRGAS